MARPARVSLMLFGGAQDPFASMRDYAAYWKMDDGAGNDFADASSNAQTVTQVNAPGSTTGQIGNCRTFAAASSQYGNKASTAVLQRAGKSWTLIYRVYHTTVGAAYQLHVSKDDGSSNREFLVAKNPSDQVELQAGGLTLATSTTLSAATWYHIVVTWNASTNVGTIIINNGTPTVSAAGSAIPTTSAPWQFATYSSVPSLFLNGRLDEVLLYDRILSAAEITLDYNRAVSL